MLKRPGGFTDGPNARSKSVTVAEGEDTFGVSTDLLWVDTAHDRL